MSFIQLLDNPYFKNFLLTIITTSLTIFIKYSTRNDAHKSFRKEDLLVGFELSITAIFITLTETTEELIKHFNKPQENIIIDNNKIIILPFLLLGMAFTLWMLSTFVRKAGWEGEEKLKMVQGILIPDAYGIFSLIIAITYTR